MLRFALAARWRAVKQALGPFRGESPLTFRARLFQSQRGLPFGNDSPQDRSVFCPENVHFRSGARLAPLPRRIAQTVLLLATSIVLESPMYGGALVMNGTFDESLDPWEIRGTVAGSTGIAVMTDDNATRSLLFQSVPATIEQFAIAFDFRNALSDTVPLGRVADSFFATLYFTDNPQTFDIDTGAYDRALPLFDLDSDGAFNVHGTISESSKGADWSRFTGTFENLHSFVVPAFELRDFNLISDDSAVALDNITIFAIPEPQVPSLAAFGAGMTIGLTRRRTPAMSV